MQLEVNVKMDPLTFNGEGYKRSVAREFLRLIDQEFSDSRDPYGNDWLKSKKKEGKTLIATSLLRRSFDFSINGDTINIGTSGAASQYANFLHLGTAPYIIRPRNKKALSFIGTGGIPVITKIVRHPGLVARYIVPIDSLGLPGSWRRTAEEELPRFITSKPT